MVFVLNFSEKLVVLAVSCVIAKCLCDGDREILSLQV